MKIHSIRKVIFFVGLFFLNPSSLAANESITIRTTPGISKAAEEYLAEVSEPSTVLFNSSYDLNNYLKIRCGTITKSYNAILTRYNQGLDLSDFNEKTDVLLPPCFHFKRNQTVNTFLGDNVWAMARRHTGWGGAKTINEIISHNNLAVITNISGTDNQVLITPNQKLTLPYQSNRVNYKLKDNITFEAVKAELLLLSNSSSGTNEFAFSEIRDEGTANHVTQISLASPNNSPSKCVEGEALSDDWPFDSQELIDVLRYNSQIRKDLALSSESRSVIAVVDSGISNSGEKVFLEDWFEKNLYELAGKIGVDDDKNGFYDDLFGTNIPTAKGNPYAFREYLAGDHGTHVAALVLGGPTFWQHHEILRQRFSIKILNLVEKRVFATPAGNRIEFRTHPSSISEAVRYAKNNKVNIVNISFTANSILQGLLDTIKSDPNLVVVVSAGNDGKRLEVINIFPAGFGGPGTNFDPRVITVAAHDSKFHLIPESNWSPILVDIAAPGCSIDSYSFDGKRVKYDGTSQAAPLVTFTAGLLRSEGIHSRNQIKKRLIISSDFRLELKDKVYSSGSLNIANTLDIYRDVVSLKDRNRTLRGKLQMPSALKLCDGWPDQTVNNILKIIPRFPVGNQSKTLYWIETSQGNLLKLMCNQLPNFQLRFKTEENNPSLKKLDWEDVLEVVFASFRF